MDWLYALIGLAFCIAFALLWAALPRSWKRVRRGGGLGPALSELNAVFDPSQRHVERVREERALERKDGEPPLE